MSKAVIVEQVKTLTKSIKASDFSRSRITHKSRNVKINSTLPFRVKFINIGIQPYGPGNAAPIGIAVIGLNNYVM
jgi:hypothetical protein